MIDAFICDAVRTPFGRYGAALSRLGTRLGTSGARLIKTAMYELHRRNGHYAPYTLRIDVGQGIAVIIERV